VTGLLARDSESRHAVGAENEIPNIREYSRKSPLAASCRAEALARDADRSYSDQVLGFGLYPRLKANVADRRTLGLGIHVMRRAPH
jgi:hypothetical protein